ncbi:DUF3857 domain-containing protein [Flavobacteriaceae bacterium SZ-1-7]|uniref:DUF3857 domain-containing protein n=1 Tax=Tamlana sedimenti TaxID=3134126 RepID=UPI00312A1CC8
MQAKYLLKFLLLFVLLKGFSQNNYYSSLTIPAKLDEYANAVVRSYDTEISLTSTDEMLVKRKRIVTVLNKKGNSNVDAYVHYDNNIKIITLEALVYNQYGALIKKIKKKDFKDESAVDGGTLYSDSRVKYLEYTPISYPYTIEFVCETSTENTAFIPSFNPLTDSYVGVESSSYSISFPESITIRKKEKNLEGCDIQKEEAQGQIKYRVKNLEAFKPEDYSPPVFDIAPKVLFASQQFTLEGVAAEVMDWNSFGHWMYRDLIANTYDLPESTINSVKDLVKNESNDIDKAKKIYQYVQDKVRYISVQVGIGGWKPFNASEVDRLGYGDCKALTNYTRALLMAVGVESNYTVVYAGSSQRSLESDFAAMQGNHVILNIPSPEENIWLECTSQKLPFGFIGDFTDDRDVLVITPEGGKIEHTKKYSTEENTQHIKGEYIISSDGFIDAKANIISKGIQYDDKYWLETQAERDLDLHYKKRWKYINTVTIDKMTLKNDKTNIAFKESIDFHASNYTKKAGNRMLLTVNALNRNTHVPDRYKTRKYPLKIKRGFIYEDDVKITLPLDYEVESLPKNILVENKFGIYKAEFIKQNDSTVVYKRKWVVNDGEFPKEDYEDFRSFFKDVSRYDNSKIALIKTQL